MRSVGRRILPLLIVFIAVVTGWGLLVALYHIPSWLIPAPQDVINKLLRTRTLPLHIQLTMTEAFAGFALSVGVGIALAVAMCNSKFLERALLPYITLLSSIPTVAIAPLLTIWLGFGMKPKIVTSMIISLAPIVVNTHKGLKSADYRIYELMRSIDATPWQTAKMIEFPSALPFIFAAFKISVPLSIVGAVVSEFYGADHGLGYLVIVSAMQLQTDMLFVAISILAFIGVASFIILSAIEKKFFSWGRSDYSPPFRAGQ